MSRTLTGPVSAAFGATAVRYLELYELDFASGYLRVSNAVHDVEWNGLTWAGWGRVGGRTAIEESGGFSAPQVTLTLSGVDPAVAAIALGEKYRNRPARIWVAPLGTDGVVLADPAGPWLYRMDTMPMNLGQTASVAVTLSTIEEQWDRAAGGRVNHQDQLARYPGDLGLQYLDQEAFAERIWGTLPVPPSTSGTTPTNSPSGNSSGYGTPAPTYVPVPGATNSPSGLGGPNVQEVSTTRLYPWGY